MKKLTVFLITLMLIVGVSGGCTGKAETPVNNEQSAQVGSTPAGKASENSPTNDGGASLDQIRKAAIDAGYAVSDEYQAAFLEDVTAGFTVQILADDQDIRYSVLECKSEDAAVQNAKTIDEAGYNIAIRNGKILSFYNVDNQDGTGKDLLASIVAGTPAAMK